MKSKKIYWLMLLIIPFVMNACFPIDDIYDEDNLVGEWVMGTVHYRYDPNGAGATWDTADDVSEAEAQRFTWTLRVAELTHIHIMENGGAGVPKTYTVTELTSSSLKYKDSFGKTFSFVKKF